MIFKSKTFFLFSFLLFHTRNLYIINHFCFTNKRFINTTEFIFNIRYIFWFVSFFFVWYCTFYLVLMFVLVLHCTDIAHPSPSLTSDEEAKKRGILKSMATYTLLMRGKDDPSRAPLCEHCNSEITRWMMDS